jgi:hypothetical protein
MVTWSLTSTATVVSASPNTQLVKVRLAITTVVTCVSSTDAWPYTLTVSGSPLEGIPYFDVPAGWPFSPVPVEP